MADERVAMMRWVWILFVSLSSASALASDFQKYVVTNSNCSVKVFDASKKEWKKAASNPLEKDIVVFGKASKGNSAVIFFKLKPSAQRLYAAEKNCAFRDFRRGSDLDLRPSRGTPGIVEAGDDGDDESGLRQQFYVSFSLMSWQEPMTFTHPDGTQYDLVDTSLGVCPGIGWEMTLWRFEVGLNGCFAFMHSELGSSTGVSNPSGYRVKNARVLGGMIGPLALWRPFSGNVALGIDLPILMRYGNWPNPASGYVISPTFSIAPVPMLEARVERGNVFVASKIGLYRSLSSIIWMFQVSYNFGDKEL